MCGSWDPAQVLDDGSPAEALRFHLRHSLLFASYQALTRTMFISASRPRPASWTQTLCWHWRDPGGSASLQERDWVPCSLYFQQYLQPDPASQQCVSSFTSSQGGSAAGCAAAPLYRRSCVCWTCRRACSLNTMPCSGSGAFLREPLPAKHYSWGIQRFANQYKTRST